MVNVLSIGFWAGIKLAMAAMSFCIAFTLLLLVMSIVIKILTVAIKAITKVVENNIENKEE